MTGVLTLYRTSIGKKVVMAVTGLILLGYVFVHMIGNLKIYQGAEHLNAYAGFLREVGAPVFSYEQILWIVRVVLLAAVVLHIVAAVQLTRQDWAGRPVRYSRKQNVQASYASFTMRWGGLVIALFVIYHVLHLTLGVVGYPGDQFRHPDPGGAFQTYSNVVNGFKAWPVSIFYILAMCALGFHIYHGTWSLVQTLGLTSRHNTIIRWFAAALALAIVIGNISIPISVLAGILQ
jgi:succinate dehydrogenase / fumarate reductase cytochrome b subunit